MKNKKTFFLSVFITISLLSLCLTSAISPATVELKNGKTLEGTLSAANESMIVLKYNFGEIEFPVKRISNIKDLTPGEIEVLNKSNFIKKNYHLVKNVALPKDDIDLTDEAYEYTKKAAVDAVQTLKDKISDNFDKEKEDIHTTYNGQMQFLEERINSLTERVAGLEKIKTSMEQEISALERSKETSLDEIKAKKSRILSLQQEINGLKANVLSKEKETAEKIKNVISENEKLYDEERNSLKDKYASEINLLKEEVVSLRTKVIEKDKLANENLMATIEKIESQQRAEKEALEKHYQAQVDALKDEQSALMQRYTFQIDGLKKDMNGLRSKLMTTQIEMDAKLTAALDEKEKHYTKEKEAATRKMRSQIVTLETEISNISQQNENLLRKDSERQTAFLKIESKDKTKDNEINKLKNEITALKKEKEDQALAYINEFDKEKSSLKYMISSSGNKLARLSQERKDFQENIKLLEEELETLKKSNEMLQAKLHLADQENSIIQQEKAILAKKIEENDNVRKAEKDEIVVGIVSEALKTDIESQGKASEKELVLSEDAKAAREALIELYKEDLMKLQQRIDDKNLELKKLANESFSLKDELENEKKEKKSAIGELSNYKERYTQLEKEKMEIKNNADLIIQQVQKQAKDDVDKEKEQLRQAYNEVISNFETRFAEKEERESTILQGIPLDDVTVDIPVTSAEVMSESIPVTTEIPITEVTVPVPQKKAPVKTAPIPSTLVQAGTVSDVGTDYGRIYIETLSSVNTGDTLWIKKDDGKSYEFKVIQVLPALKGAIAEITVIDQISDINENDPVFSME